MNKFINTRCSTHFSRYKDESAKVVSLELLTRLSGVKRKNKFNKAL